MSQFEYIIAGGGAAGLTLACLLTDNESTKKPILIIDKDNKTSNDRTWCFWEKGDNLFENLVSHSWEQGLFRSDRFEQIYDIAPYRYKMIQGADFYEFVKQHLAQHSQVTWIQDEVINISADGKVETTGGAFQANLVFDSTPSFDSFNDISSHNLLLQHFKGYFIKTPKPVFDPQVFTYMDLNVDQQGDFRFGYVLPSSPTEALVEYTLFSPAMLSDEEYTKGLTSYIQHNLGIAEYEVQEEEFGVIPMTDYPFTAKMSDHHIRIGISGGFAKPSTGYTFLRGQKILKQMVENLSQDRPLLSNLPFQQRRFKAYDSTLLKVLSKENNVGRQAFSDMFRKQGMQRMFRFLDEETSLTEELAIMSATPLLTFGKAFFESVTKS